jgi:hypothetical protein
MIAACWNITIPRQAGSFRSAPLVGSSCETTAQGSEQSLSLKLPRLTVDSSEAPLLGHVFTRSGVEMHLGEDGSGYARRSWAKG